MQRMGDVYELEVEDADGTLHQLAIRILDPVAGQWQALDGLVWDAEADQWQPIDTLEAGEVAAMCHDYIDDHLREYAIICEAA